LDTTFLFAYIDSVGDLVQNAQARHFQKWPILGVSGPAPEVNPVAITYAAELDTLKSWIARRLDWLDLNIPGQCTIQASVPERGGDQGLLIYPNPSNGAFHFQGTFTAQGPLQLSIHDLTWREIDRFTLPTGRVDIDHEIRESGTYFFTVRSQGRILRTGKLVVL
jgi:hypothetical protein